MGIEVLDSRQSDRRAHPLTMRRRDGGPVPSALIVDDAPTVRVVLGRMLRHAGVDTFEAGDERTMESIREAHQFDVVFLDLNLGNVNGLDLLREMRRRGDRTPVVVVSAGRSVRVVQEVLTAGIVDFIAKPFERERVIRALRRAVPELALIDP